MLYITLIFYNILVSNAYWYCNRKTDDRSCSGGFNFLIFFVYIACHETVFIISVFLCDIKDGAARPMTAVRAAGYSSSLAKGDFISFF